MRPHDDSPRASVRPSLLTPAQQAEADRNRILTTLQGGKAGAVAGGAPGGRRAVRYGTGAAAALLLLAAGVWLGQRGADGQALAPAALPAAATVPPAPPAAARIHDEAPAAIDPAPRQSLNDMLTAAPARPPAATPPADMLSKALETPSAPAARPARTPAKTPAKSVPKAAHPPAKKPAAKAEAAASTSREEESDIALLAALVAHAQAVPAPPSSLRSQLQQCASLKRAAADACRERVCKGRGAGNSLCKAAKSAAKAGA